MDRQTDRQMESQTDITTQYKCEETLLRNSIFPTLSYCLFLNLIQKDNSGIGNVMLNYKEKKNRIFLKYSIDIDNFKNIL